MTTYQKLKKENEQLRRELYLVCNKPIANTAEVWSIIAREKMKAKIEMQLFSGNPLTFNKSFSGVLKQISNGTN